jgi:hypothetical protein
MFTRALACGNVPAVGCWTVMCTPRSLARAIRSPIRPPCCMTRVRAGRAADPLMDGRDGVEEHGHGPVTECVRADRPAPADGRGERVGELARIPQQLAVVPRPSGIRLFQRGGLDTAMSRHILHVMAGAPRGVSPPRQGAC